MKCSKCGFENPQNSSFCGEAVRLLEQTLQVQEVLDPEDKAKRCDLLLALSEAPMDAREPRHALDILAFL